MKNYLVVAINHYKLIFLINYKKLRLIEKSQSIKVKEFYNQLLKKLNSKIKIFLKKIKTHNHIHQY